MSQIKVRSTVDQVNLHSRNYWGKTASLCTTFQ